MSIFRSAGSSLEARYATIIVGFVQFVFTVASGFLVSRLYLQHVLILNDVFNSFYLQVDRFGRRVLLFGSGFVSAISLTAMGTFFFFQNKWGEDEATKTLGWLPLVSLIVFFIAYSCGFANIPFIIMGELLPMRYRTILGPISSSFNVTCTFIIVRFFPAMQSSGLGKDGTFWLFAASTFASLFFIYFLLPETKGKTLEEIERMFSKDHHKPRNSSIHNRSIKTISNVVDSGKTASIDAGLPDMNCHHDNLGFHHDATDGRLSDVNSTSGTKSADEGSFKESDSDDDSEDEDMLVPAPA